MALHRGSWHIILMLLLSISMSTYSFIEAKEEELVCLQGSYVTSATARVTQLSAQQRKVDLDLVLDYENTVLVENFLIEGADSSGQLTFNGKNVLTKRLNIVNKEMILRQEEIRDSNGTVKKLIQYTMANYKTESIKAIEKMKELLQGNNTLDKGINNTEVICSPLLFYQADYVVPLKNNYLLQVVYHDHLRCVRKLLYNSSYWNSQKSLRLLRDVPIGRKWTNVISASYSNGFLFEFTAEGLISIMNFVRGKEPSEANPLGTMATRTVRWLTYMAGYNGPFWNSRYAQPEPYIEDQVCQQLLARENLKFVQSGFWWETLRPKPFRTACDYRNNAFWGIGSTNGGLEDSEKLIPGGFAQISAQNPPPYPNGEIVQNQGMKLLFGSGATIEATTECTFPFLYPDPNNPSNLIPNWQNGQSNSFVRHTITRNKTTDELEYYIMWPIQYQNLFTYFAPNVAKNALMRYFPPDDIALRNGCNQIIGLFGMMYINVGRNSHIYEYNYDTVNILPMEPVPIDAFFIEYVRQQATPTTVPILKHLYYFFTKSRSLIIAEEHAPFECQLIQFKIVESVRLINEWPRFEKPPPILLFPEGHLLARKELESSSQPPINDQTTYPPNPNDNEITLKPPKSDQPSVNTDIDVSHLLIYLIGGFFLTIFTIIIITIIIRQCCSSKRIVFYSTSNVDNSDVSVRSSVNQHQKPVSGTKRSKTIESQSRKVKHHSQTQLPKPIQATPISETATNYTSQHPAENLSLMHASKDSQLPAPPVRHYQDMHSPAIYKTLESGHPDTMERPLARALQTPRRQTQTPPPKTLKLPKTPRSPLNMPVSRSSPKPKDKSPHHANSHHTRSNAQTPRSPLSPRRAAPVRKKRPKASRITPRTSSKANLSK